MSYNVSYFFDTPNSGFNGPSGSLCSLKSSSNLLYGYKNGVPDGIYSIQSDGTNLQVLVDYSTIQSQGLAGFSTFVSDYQNTLYAIAVDTTSGYTKTLVSFDTSTSSVLILQDGGSNVNLGSNTPIYPLVIDTTNKILYGIRQDNAGSYYIFSYNLNTSTYNDSLYVFIATNGNPSGPLSISSDFTKLYGVSQQFTQIPGYLYSITNLNGIATLNILYTFDNSNITNILSPIANLLLDGNYLYGRCSIGGLNNLGGVFIFNLNTNVLTPIPFNQNNYYIFNAGGFDGGLVKVNNNLYGLANSSYTSSGSQTFSSLGSVWCCNLTTNTFSTIHNFTFGPSDGFPTSYSKTGLALALDTFNSSSINILGLTNGGGNNIGASGGAPGDGTIFKISITNEPQPPGPIVCYVKGTQILTSQGYKQIEDIKNGDYLLSSGKIMDGMAHMAKSYSFEQVIWSSFFKINKNNINTKSSPICIKQNSLGINQPIRDLYVSPNHGIIVKGKIVPAKYLINGKNIYQIKGLDSVEYYHVELNRHSVIIAEGILTESYLNENTKHIFKEAPTLKIKKNYDYNDYDYNNYENFVNSKSNMMINVFKFSKLKR
jgi:hypothetical protein